MRRCDFCNCKPIVFPSPKARKHIEQLRILFYCDVGIAILYFTGQLFSMAILECLNCLILYMTFKQVNFCFGIIYMFLMMINCINLVCSLGHTIQNSDLPTTSYGYFVYSLMYIALFFYCAALYFTFIAYREFKALAYESYMPEYAQMPQNVQQPETYMRPQFQPQRPSPQQYPPFPPPQAHLQMYGPQASQPPQFGPSKKFPGKGVKLGGL